MKRDIFFILCGPTGSGKTDLSYLMAEKFPFEIVNCDVGQCYEPLTIGTAKPDWQNHPVAHHLFDFIAEPRNMTVVEYRTRLQETMQDIWSRKKIPLLVGGSLFYVRSLFFPPIEQKISSTPTSFENKTTEELWSMLHAVDPERAQSIKKEDRYRLERALQLWQTTGIAPSQCAPVFQPLGSFYLTFVTRDRAELYARINQRVEHMFAQGWVHETANLSAAWKQFLMQKKLLGYDTILSCLEQTSEYECARNKELMATIAQKTRNYAKRQETFWRSFKKDIEEVVQKEYGEQARSQGMLEEVNLTRFSIDVYLDHIQSFMTKKEFHESRT